MVSVIEVRRRCRTYARQFGYALHLFDRIPMYIFHYFRSTDPFNQVSTSFDQFDIITICMIINRINANLMTSFYAAGDQTFDILLRLNDFFNTMWRLYDAASHADLYGIFGTFFVYHLESRSLHRIDMTVVNHYRGRRQQNDFVPSHPNWRRSRDVRMLIRSGQFQVLDDYDILEVQMAFREGLFRRVHINRN